MIGRNNGVMRQLQLFTRAELAAMRDHTRRRDYSPEADEFRRDHQRRRAAGLKQRHAQRSRRLRDGDLVPHNGFLVHRHRVPAAAGPLPSAPSAADPSRLATGAVSPAPLPPAGRAGKPMTDPDPRAAGASRPAAHPVRPAVSTAAHRENEQPAGPSTAPETQPRTQPVRPQARRQSRPAACRPVHRGVRAPGTTPQPGPRAVGTGKPVRAPPTTDRHTIHGPCFSNRARNPAANGWDR